MAIDSFAFLIEIYCSSTFKKKSTRQERLTEPASKRSIRKTRFVKHNLLKLLFENGYEELGQNKQ